eukprot:15468141-Alexandrium_andersonii.AAC.1
MAMLFVIVSSLVGLNANGGHLVPFGEGLSGRRAADRRTADHARGAQVEQNKSTNKRTRPG